MEMPEQTCRANYRTTPTTLQIGEVESRGIYNIYLSGNL